MNINLMRSVRQEIIGPLGLSTAGSLLNTDDPDDSDSEPAGEPFGEGPDRPGQKGSTRPRLIMPCLVDGELVFEDLDPAQNADRLLEAMQARAGNGDTMQRPATGSRSSPGSSSSLTQSLETG